MIVTWCSKCNPPQFVSGTGKCPVCGHDRKDYNPVRIADKEVRRSEFQSDPGLLSRKR
jgi:uncharacterized Zn finger protein (UPF0148 family)